jgi:hypothetical protein
MQIFWTHVHASQKNIVIASRAPQGVFLQPELLVTFQLGFCSSDLDFNFLSQFYISPGKLHLDLPSGQYKTRKGFLTILHKGLH